MKKMMKFIGLLACILGSLNFMYLNYNIVAGVEQSYHSPSISSLVILAKVRRKLGGSF